MFEFSVAFKYLMPRWRQLSVSIISLISVLVIALVVWLIVVFFSVTHGLEHSWIQKLIALTAPVRVTPTEEYYRSYYYLSDSISEKAEYTLKSLGEKLESPIADSYDPDSDEEIPIHWPPPDLGGDGELKDLAKLAFSSIREIRDIPGLVAKDYEMTVSNLQLRLVREGARQPFLEEPGSAQNPKLLSQVMYISSYDPSNPILAMVMSPVTQKDVRNLLETADANTRESPSSESKAALKNIFNTLHVKAFKTPVEGWRIPRHLLPEKCKLDVCVVKVGKQIKGVYIPKDPSGIEPYRKKKTIENMRTFSGVLEGDGNKLYLKIDGSDPIALEERIPLIAEGGIPVVAQIVPETIETVNNYRGIKFNSTLNLQKVKFAGEIAFGNLEIDAFDLLPGKSGDSWLLDSSIPESLPSDPIMGEGIILPKSYKESGVLIGDRGHLSYSVPTASSVQEQRTPIFVAGFYDPGILPLGRKLLHANKNITSMIRAAYPQDENGMSNGINVRFKNLEDADLVKAKLQTAFEKGGINKYWHVETYKEFEFTKDMLQQLHSERNLFTLISAVIIIVACSNIVSMLVILVNDKKMEIGILRSMGASSYSIAAIFGLCGIVMGVMGSLLGTALALFTLNNLQGLIDFISRVQGFNAFNPMFYGETLPNQVSVEALGFVIGTTAIISLIAGVVPAVKASLLRPAAILRSE